MRSWRPVIDKAVFRVSTCREPWMRRKAQMITRTIPYTKLGKGGDGSNLRADDGIMRACRVAGGNPWRRSICGGMFDTDLMLKIDSIARLGDSTEPVNTRVDTMSLFCEMHEPVGSMTTQADLRQSLRRHGFDFAAEGHHAYRVRVVVLMPSATRGVSCSCLAT